MSNLVKDWKNMEKRALVAFLNCIMLQHFIQNKMPFVVYKIAVHISTLCAVTDSHLKLFPEQTGHESRNMPTNYGV